jgi:peptidyl-prolyl cis-trans isomerase C
MRASHILVDNLELAKELRQLINLNSSNFEEMAKKFSKCPSSNNGGDLGEFGPGQMVKPFEDAVASINVGSHTGPVQTQFGYHIIKRTG